MQRITKRSVRLTILAGLAATAALLASPATAGASPLLNGNFEVGNLSQWGTCQTRTWNSSCANMPASYSIQTVTSPSRQGNYAARFEVRDGDVPSFGGGERAEVNTSIAKTGATEGAEGWYQWSTRVEPGLPVNGWGAVFAQFHSGSGSPPLALATTNTAGYWGLEMFGNTTIWKTPMTPGSWQDFKLHVKWSTSASIGYVELWHNGVRQSFNGGSAGANCKNLTRCSVATMANGSAGNYFKQGYYRDQVTTATGVVYHDGYSAGTTEADLVPLTQTAKATR